MLWIGARRFRARMQGAYTHEPHQALYALAVDLKAVAIPKVISQSARAFKGALQMQLIQLAHQIDVLGTGTCRFSVGGGAADIQRPALSTDGEFMCPVQLFFALGHTQRPSALAKKSFSSANSPILACRFFR